MYVLPVSSLTVKGGKQIFIKYETAVMGKHGVKWALKPP